MRWPRTRTKHITAIASALKKADTLYLATDPDREGEAISWHLQEVLGERGTAEGPRGLPGRVLRDHRARGAGGHRAAPPGLHGSGQCLPRPPRARPSARLQALAAAVAEDQPANCRPAECRARRCACWSSARRPSRHSAARNTGPSRRRREPRRSCSRRAWSSTPAARWSTASIARSRDVQLPERGPGRRGPQHARGCCRRQAARQGRGAQPAPAPPGAAVHDLDAAAGSLTQAGLPVPATPCRLRRSSTKALPSKRAPSA